MNLIFLLPAAADLARASTACVSFRRVITAHSFLRRFRTLHPPPLLGMLCGGLTIAQPPHPSAAAAATLADVDFSCPFLPPSPDRWCRRGVRNGRALFSPRLQGNRAVRNPRDLVTEFAVCDPLHHRYLLLPALPGHLAGQVHPPDILECEPFLAPPGHDEDSSFRDFRVMCLVRCTTKLVLFVFFSCAGQWLTDRITSDVFGCGASDRYYANECFCWHAYYDDDDVEMLLLLDARRMEFSVVDLPPPHCMRQVAIVEAGEGRLGMLTVDGTKHPAHRLLYAVHSQDGNGANQWQSRSVFPLPENYRYYIRGVAGGYLLLAGYPEDNRRIADYFSLDLQTFQVEWFCQTGYYVMNGHLYADLPPSLSPPTL